MHIIDICKQKLHQFRFQGEHNLTVTIVNILSSIWFYVNTPIEHCNKLTRLLSLQGGDLLLETGILGLLVREVALHLRALSPVSVLPCIDRRTYSLQAVGCLLSCLPREKTWTLLI